MLGHTYRHSMSTCNLAHSMVIMIACMCRVSVVDFFFRELIQCNNTARRCVCPLDLEARARLDAHYPRGVSHFVRRVGGLIRASAALLRANSVCGARGRIEAARASGLPHHHGQEAKPRAGLSEAATSHS